MAGDRTAGHFRPIGCAGDHAGFGKGHRNCSGGDSVDLDVTLKPAIYQLATVVVHRDSSYAMRSDPTGFDRRRKNGMGHYIAVNVIPISAVRGVEVYSGPATTPEELVTSRTVCGTVGIWTR